MYNRRNLGYVPLRAAWPPSPDFPAPSPMKPPPKTTHPAVKYVKAPLEDTGKYRVQIDEVALYDAALTHASFSHLGRIFGVSGQRLSMEPFRSIIERARAVRKQELLAAQFNTAITDRNPTMQIWLGKQYLDQKDVQRVETTGADGGPVKQETTVKAIAYFPDNGRTRQVQPPTTKLAQRIAGPPDPNMIPTHGTQEAEAEDPDDQGATDLELIPAKEPIDVVARARGLLPARAGSQPPTPAGPPGSTSPAPPATAQGGKRRPGRPRGRPS